MMWFPAVLILFYISPTTSKLNVTIQRHFTNKYEIYQNYFFITHDIKIIQLKYHDDFDQYTEDLMKNFYELNLKFVWKALWIEDYTITAKSNLKEKIEPFESIKVQNVERLANLENPLKYIYFDKELSTVIIGKDPDMIFSYLQSVDMYIFTRNGRGLFIIILSSPNVNVIEAQRILVLLWKKFSIISVVIQIPYSSELSDFVFIYRPFIPTDHGYGQVHIYKYADVVNYPHILFNQVTNLYGYPLRISLFERYPTSLKNIPWFMRNSRKYRNIQNTSKMFGVDGLTISELSIRMNFSISLYYGPNSDSFGNVQSNGTITGTFAETIKRNIDLQANLRYLTIYGTNNYEFTLFYDSDQICVVVPKAGRVPKWLMTFHLFQGNLGLHILVILILSSVLYKYLLNISFAN
ncbi:uncharacterized protein LOC115875633 [Sitophilus oryzae]|uniref:Uncharacterized protein LOC115875633 n=1 Tax=Sitophilus oryzae TaxID=7048 RepID=A0A6J2X811_SITOR|nr:uncharacterized protein LOC115875633 [Sitophilus oryzae]